MAKHQWSPDYARTFNELHYYRVAPGWPQRLLHIPTMTSFERVGVCTYNGVSSPAYDIISYTWGRFEANPGSPALPVRNIGWSIPPVKQDCFSVDAFQNVINYIGLKTDWLWIDVACIDQENYEAKMNEVRRQFAIFHRARRAYVWLHSLDNIAAQHLIGEIQEFAFFSRRWDAMDGPQLEERIPLMLSQLPLFLNILKKLFQDPWFTSLWTLQESVLRRDAILLCREATPLLWSEDTKLQTIYQTLQNLSGDCQTIWEGIYDHLQESRIPEQLVEAAIEVMTRLEKSGFQRRFCHNPNFWYGAARYRQTKFPLDRVFGILALFSLTEEESATLTDGASDLEDLEDRLALLLNQRSPILGQCFVHLEIPTPGQSWRINQVSTLPSDDGTSRFHNANVLNPCRVSRLPTQAVQFKGKAVPFSVLLVYWKHMLERGSYFCGAKAGFMHQVFFDHVVHKIWPPVGGGARPEPYAEQTSRAKGFPLTEQLAKNVPGTEIMVLLLGQMDWTVKTRSGTVLETAHLFDDCPHFPHIIQKEVDSELQANEEDVMTVGGIRWGLRWSKTKAQRKLAAGMIILRQDGRFRRIGFCYWDDDSSMAHELLDWTVQID